MQGVASSAERPATEFERADPIAPILRLPRRVAVLLRDTGNTAREYVGTVPARCYSRSAVGSPTAVERAICVRDLVRSTTMRLVQLRDDVRPVAAHCYISQPIAGYHRWDPVLIVASLRSECARLGRLVEELSVADRFPCRVRDGLVLIATELVEQVAVEGRAYFSHGGSDSLTDYGVRSSSHCDVLALLASLPGRLDLFLTADGEPLTHDESAQEAGYRRVAVGTPTAMERAICVVDHVRHTAKRLEKLVSDVRPVEARCHVSEPVGAYHRWDPELILTSLASETARLGRLTNGFAVAPTRPVRIRGGLDLIGTELLRDLVAVANSHLVEAQKCHRSVSEMKEPRPAWQ